MFDQEEYFNPFPGLRSFEEEEEFLFFGREKHIDELLKKLRTNRFLAVIGASGSGKSSLVKSGLLPSLHSGFMSGAGSNWKIVTFRPGSDPIGNFCEALSEPGLLYPEEADMPYQQIINSTLRRSQMGLVEAVKQSAITPEQNMLVVVDQFEELFRFSRFERENQFGSRDSHAFINLLLNAFKQTERPIYIVLTMRSDFLGDCTEFRGLPEAINDGQYLIPRMSREEFKMAITGPIAVGGAEVSPQLVTTLLNDTGDNPDQLPILQHALMRTWEYWSRNAAPEDSITMEHYEAIGGMGEALSIHAEEAYDELETDEERWVCQMLFKMLTDRGTDGRGTRRPTKLTELQQQTGVAQDKIVNVINIFREKGRSFLMPPVSKELNDDAIIDISHESLMRVWRRLIDWVTDEIESAEVYLRLAEAARLHQEGVGGEWRDPELAIAINWRQNAQPTAKWADRYDPSFDRAIAFLDHSFDLSEFEKRSREERQKAAIRRARRTAGIFFVITIIALGVGVVAFNLKQKADEKTVEAEMRKTEADEQRKKAEASEVVAKEKAIEASQQKQIAEGEREKAVEAQKEAEHQKEVAVVARDRAVAAESEAVKQKEKAEASEEAAVIAQGEAEEAQQLAEEERDRAERQRKLAEARNRANDVVNDLTGDFDSIICAAAIMAYDTNAKYEGPTLNNDIYQGLYSSLLTSTPKRFVYSGHFNAIRSIVATSNGTVITGDDNGILRFSSIQSDTTLKWQGQLKLPDKGVRVRSLLPTQDGKRLIVGAFDGYKGSLYIVDITTKTIIGEQIKNDAFIGAIDELTWVQTPAGERLLFMTSDRLFLSLNDAAGISTDTFSKQSVADLSALVAGSDGSTVYMSTGSTLKALDFGQHTNLTSAIANATTLSGASPNGSKIVEIAVCDDYLAVGHQDGQVALARLENNAWRFYPEQYHQTEISALQFHKQGGNCVLAASSYDRTLTIQDVNDFFASVDQTRDSDEAEEDRIRFKGHNDWVHDLAFVSNGAVLLSVSADDKIRMWFTANKSLAWQLDQVLHNTQ